MNTTTQLGPPTVELFTSLSEWLQGNPVQEGTTVVAQFQNSKHTHETSFEVLVHGDDRQYVEGLAEFFGASEHRVQTIPRTSTDGSFKAHEWAVGNRRVVWYDHS